MSKGIKKKLCVLIPIGLYNKSIVLCNLAMSKIGFYLFNNPFKNPYLSKTYNDDRSLILCSQMIEHFFTSVFASLISLASFYTLLILVRLILFLFVQSFWIIEKRGLNYSTAANYTFFKLLSRSLSYQENMLTSGIFLS